MIDWKKYGLLMEACTGYCREKMAEGDNPLKIASVMFPLIREHENQEGLYVIMLDTKMRIIGSPLLITLGLLDRSMAHPREVFKPAILNNAKSIIMAHNHPGGDLSPSASDKALTKAVYRSGEILCINLLDHLILAKTQNGWEYVSLLEQGEFHSIVKGE